MRTRDNKEMPLYIKSADFSGKLGLYSRNADSTDRFLSKGVEPFGLPGLLLPFGYSLLKSLQEKQYRIITSSDGKPYTAYAVKLITDNEITFPHTAATQVMVWRTPSIMHKPVIDGFPQRFFTWLLDEYSIVVSDSEQTGDGQRFWLTMLDWAFRSDYHLYVADGTEGEDWPKTHINTLAELEDRWLQYAWGYDREAHTHRRLIISKIKF